MQFMLRLAVTVSGGSHAAKAGDHIFTVTRLLALFVFCSTGAAV
jgi:hypothetical protein